VISCKGRAPISPELKVSRLNRILSFRPSRTWSYGFAVLSIAMALLISRWAAPHIGFPGTLFLCVIVLSAWYGGVGPGLLATVLSSLAFHYSFQHPNYFGIAQQRFFPSGLKPQEMPRLLMYIVSNLLIGSLSVAQRNAKESLRHARDDLDRTVRDLQRTNEALQVESLERKQAEEVLRRAQADLARVSRVTTLGELTASLAHEVNQPIAATVTSANSCIRWLSAEVPNLDKARAAAERIVKDGTRAAEIIGRTRLLFQKGLQEWELVDIHQVIAEMIVLLGGEATRYAVCVRTELAEDLTQVMGDHVQLQQVMMNLMMNSIDAMKDVDGARDLVIMTQRGEKQRLLVSVSDSGVGLPPEHVDRIFDAFFTTKPHGTGMGLRICRSIVESHGGRMWAANNHDRGASFYVSLPTKVETVE
jgi:C4-dicarboxylate-specific signal transduction histidine kinase